MENFRRTLSFRTRRSPTQEPNAAHYRFQREEKIDIIVEDVILEFSRQVLCDESLVIKALIAKDPKSKVEFKGRRVDTEMMLCFLSPDEKEPDVDARRMLPLSDEYRIIRLKTRCEELLMEEDKHLEHIYLARKYNLMKLLPMAINACGEKTKWNLIFESGPLFESVGLTSDKFLIKPSEIEKRYGSIIVKVYTDEDCAAARTAVKLTERNAASLKLLDNSFFRLMDNYYRYPNLHDMVTYYDGEKIMTVVEKWIDGSILCQIFSAQLDKLDEAVEQK